ncbi:MAG TPA: hypothetical protein VLB76_02280 [Thermoanaerobaculia bacterium]|jgi:hypothetical protein|nr:hypothetical protein [Thermoanaerobaculia bacterium]
MGINPNHNQTVIRPETGIRILNHDQTIVDQALVRFLGGLATNHNQTVKRPELSIRIANHNQTVAR